MQPATSGTSSTTEALTGSFTTHPLNLSLSGMTPPFSTSSYAPITVTAVTEQFTATELAKRLRPGVPLAVSSSSSANPGVFAPSNGQLRQTQPVTPGPQFNLVSLPTNFEPISPLDFHIRPDVHAESSQKTKVADDPDLLSSSGGFQPQLSAAGTRTDGGGSAPETPSKAKRRKAQLELLDAEPAASRYETATVSGSLSALTCGPSLSTTTTNSTVQLSFGLAPQTDVNVKQIVSEERGGLSALGNGSHSHHGLVASSSGRTKRKKRNNVPDDEPDPVSEMNKPARFNLIRVHYSFHTKWTRSLKRRHFERSQHVTTSRVQNTADYDGTDDSERSDAESDADADDADDRRAVGSSQNRARLRVAGVLEQLMAISSDDAEMARRACACTGLLPNELEKRIAIHSEQLRRTVGEASQLLVDAFDRHSKIRRSVKQNSA